MNKKLNAAIEKETREADEARSANTLQTAEESRGDENHDWIKQEENYMVSHGDHLAAQFAWIHIDPIGFLAEHGSSPANMFF